MKLYFFLLFALCWTSFATCSSRNLLTPISDCVADDSSIFTEEKSYQFNYDFETVEKLNEFSHPVHLIIKCNVKVEVIGSCQYILNTNNCSLYDGLNRVHAKSRLFSKQMEKYPVLFSMYDGSIDSVSAHADEDLTLLNVKRGIISLFQTARLDEQLDSEIFYKNLNGPQGVCNVSYRHLNSYGSQWIIVSEKDTQMCSLANESTKLIVIDGAFTLTETCEHLFNKKEDSYLLNIVTCNETAPTFGSGLFHPITSRKLYFIKTLPLVEKSINYIDGYRLTNMNYENQSSPFNNPPNLKKNVITLIDKMIDAIDSPAGYQLLWYFNDIVDILKSSVNLAGLSTGIDDCWGSTRCQTANNKNALKNRIFVGHIWRDALLQCNSVTCIKGLKSFVTQNPPSMAEAIEDEVMTKVFLTWLIRGNDDPEFIRNIYDICKLNNQTLCYLAMSSNINRFWKTNPDEHIIEKVKPIVERVIESIKECGSASAEEDSNVLLSLKMLSNIGEFAEEVEPNVTDILQSCVTNVKADWEISLTSLAAFRRMKSSDGMYRNLLNIMKNPSFNHELHVNAYLMLIEKWAENAVDDIGAILLAKETDGNLKAFICSHIRAVLRAQDSARLELAKAFRKFVDENTWLFFQYSVLDSKFISKYEEQGLYYLLLERPGNEGVMGLHFPGFQLYDGTSFLPFAAGKTWKLILFGVEYDITESSFYSKGFVNIVTTALQHIINTNQESILLSQMLFNPKFRTTKPKFVPPNIDENVARNLEEIINKLPDMFSTKSSILFNAKVLYEESVYAMFLPILTSVLSKTGVQAGESALRTFTKLVNRSIVLPTSGGLLMTVFMESDSMAFIDSKTTHHELIPKEMTVFGINKDLSLGVSLNLKMGTEVELSGFHRFGYTNEFFVSSSGAITADASMDMTPNGKKTFRLDLPANSKQTLYISNHYVLTNGESREFTFSSEDLKAVKCSDFVLGSKWCTRHLYKPGRNFYYSVHLQAPETHPIAVQLKSKSSCSAEQNSYNVSLNVLNENPRSVNHILNFIYSQDKTKDVHDIIVDSELLRNFKLAIYLKNLESENSEMHLNWFISQNLKLRYHVKNSVSKSDDGETSVAVERLAKVSATKKNGFYRHSTHNLVLSTTLGNFTVVYTKRLLPISSNSNLSMQFKCVNKDAGDWLKMILNMPVVWEDSQTVKLEMHHEKESVLQNLASQIPEENSFTVFKLPKYSIEMNSQVTMVDEHSSLSTVNVSTFTLPERTPELSYRMVLLEKRVEDDDGGVTSENFATFSVPHLMYVFSLNRHHNERKNHRVALKLQRRVNSDNYDVHQSNADYYSLVEYASPSIDEISFEVNNDITVDETDSKTYDIVSNFNYIKTTDEEEAVIQNIRFNCIYSNNNFSVIYGLNFTDQNRTFLGNAKLTKPHYALLQLALVDHSNETIANLDISITNDAPLLTYNYNFTSEVYTYLSRLQWNRAYMNAWLDFNISAMASDWDLLNVELKQYMNEEGETMSMQHELMDIDVEASWTSGYKKSFGFNSKTDLIPSMRWNLDCESRHRCIGQIAFANPQFSTIIIVYEMSTKATEISITVCQNELCKDIKSDVENFRWKTVFGVLDPFTVVRTTVANPEFYLQVKKNFQSLTENVFRYYLMIVGDSDHAIYKMFEYYVGASLEETQFEFAEIFRSSTAMIGSDFGVVFGPTLPGFLYVGGTLSNAIKIMSPITFAYKEHGVVMWYSIFQIAGYFGSFSERLGPHPGYSSVSDLQLPLALDDFMGLRRLCLMQLNSEIYNLLEIFTEEKKIIHDVFYDEEFSRVALLIGNDIISPFDGDLVRIGRQLTYLLAYDVEAQKFAVYKEDFWLHFIFGKCHIQLLYNDGRLMVNSTHHDLPFENWNREFNIIRVEDIVIINTSYHLKVVCDVHGYYCVIYSDLWKYGKLYGLLGNNTDMLHAGITEYSRNGAVFELTGHIPTWVSLPKDILISPNLLRDCWKYPNISFYLMTGSCHHLINPEIYFRKCLMFSHLDEDADHLMYAYTAACGALNAPIDVNYDYQKCEGLDDVKSIGTEYEERWSDKKLDVVFIVDQSLDQSSWKNYAKSLTKLALSIERDFEEESFSNVRFGLFGFRGAGALNKPVLYTTNSQLWASANDFSTSALHSLFSLNSSNISDRSSKAGFDAIRHAVNTATFNVETVRVIILVTPHDPFDRIVVEELYEILASLNSRLTTLYTISNYEEMPKRAYGIVGDELLKPENFKKTIPVPPGGFKNLIQGHYARLSAATNGAIWSLSYLEGGIKDEDSKEFESEILKTLKTRAEHYADGRFRCVCQRPKFFKANPSCRLVRAG